MEPSSDTTESRLLKLVTVSSFCPFTLISLLVPLVLFVINLLFSALLAMPWALLRRRSGKLRTQILKSHLVRTQSLNVLPLKPGVGQYIAIIATLTARDFFLSCLFLHFRSIHLHFFQTSPDFSLCWLWPTHGSCVGPQNKIGHPAGCRFPC